MIENDLFDQKTFEKMCFLCDEKYYKEFFLENILFNFLVWDHKRRRKLRIFKRKVKRRQKTVFKLKMVVSVFYMVVFAFFSVSFNKNPPV